MGKGRFTALDVSAIVYDLKRRVVGARVANVYDLNARTYLLKFSGKDEGRQYVLIESGIRCHATTFERRATDSGTAAADRMPNHFTSKLRKCLRSKKVSNVAQVGRDRVIIFTFGMQDDKKLHLVCELYGGGNVILCDHTYRIIVCLRTHGDSKRDIHVHSGQTYAIQTPPQQHQRLDDTSFIAQRLRKCIGELLMPALDMHHATSTTEALSSKQRRRKQRMQNRAAQNVSDFVVQTLGVSGLIADCLMRRCGVDAKQPLLEYAMHPHPKLRRVRVPRNQEDGDSEEDEDEEEDEEEEDEMYRGISSNDEKLKAMRLQSDKFECLMQCFAMFEQFLQSISSDDASSAPTQCKGFIISKRVSLLDGGQKKKVSVFVKKKRRKQIVTKIDLTQAEQEEACDEEEDQAEGGEEEEEKETDKTDKWIYDEFIPFAIDADMLSADSTLEEFVTFNQSVDEFFTAHEAMKSEHKQTHQERVAYKKLDTATQQHADRIAELVSTADRYGLFATVVEENLDLVDTAINGINTLLSQGINWNDLANRIREETVYGNPIAQIIAVLNLHESRITLTLQHEIAMECESSVNGDDNQYANDDDDDEEEEDVLSDMFDDDDHNDGDGSKNEQQQQTQTRTETHRIDVELGLSAWNNARKYWLQRKQLFEKRDKTEQATALAFKAAEKKSKQALSEAKQTQQILKLRKTYWFEKFFWFISSDNLLVIAGRDAQQNELIVKKYMDRQCDIYCHAQIHGASSVIIKNHLRVAQIPPRTLNEAGCFCVCRSKAWDNHIPAQAYWVHGSQVSKTPQSGQFLPTGSFVIRGKRNFIETQLLSMGVVLMFRVSKAESHSTERRPHYLDGDDDDDANVQAQDEDNAVFVTKTMVQSSVKSRREFEQQQQEQKNAQKVTDKKLAKYGFDNKDKNKEATDATTATIATAKGKKRGKKSGKYNKMYDAKDRQLVEQLLGLQPREPQEQPQLPEEEKEAQKQKEALVQEPTEGYELNAVPQKQAHEKGHGQDNDNDDGRNDDNEAEEEDEYGKQRKFALLNALSDELSLLTGKPNEDDVVLFCMAMCAPYSAICREHEYEYKIKVQPGTNKRGRAIKHVFDIFEAQIKDNTLRDKLNLLALMKSIKDTEINHVFLSNVKLSCPGMKALEQKQKQNQKNAQKEKWKQQHQKQLQNQSKNQNKSNVHPKKRKKK